MDNINNSIVLYECPICMESYNTKNMINLQCGHIYCYDCFNQYILTNLDMGNIKELKCPYPDCNNGIDKTVIRLNINNYDIINRFEKLLKVGHEYQEDVRWCPNLKCGKIINLHNNQINKRLIKCTHCNSEICTNCEILSHGYIPCNIHKRWRRMISRSERAKHKKCKKCPKCKQYIHKIEGCHHMKCTFCNVKFCWHCKHIYNIYGPNKHCRTRKIFKYWLPIGIFIFIIAVITFPIWIVPGFICLYIIHNIHKR